MNIAIQRAGMLLVSVVRRGSAEHLVDITRKAGAGGGTVLYGRGTAGNRILRLLGLADTEKEIVFTLARASLMPDIISALRNAPDLCRKVPGIGFVINAPLFLRPEQGGSEEKDSSMPEDLGQPAVSHELICVVVNAGFADDVMYEARAAGATGGTILKARGTASGQDAGFFGITIVPEKEMLMVLAKKEASGKILEAIAETPCLAEPGCGIAFCLPVVDFFPLGLAAQKKA